MSDTQTRCGTIALMGRPNAGKSTLLNQLLGEKAAIATHKAQTTRTCLRGVKTIDNDQLIFVDTPGLHRHERQQSSNRDMNREAIRASEEADIIVFMTSGLQWQTHDDKALSTLPKPEGRRQPVLLCVNKCDRITDADKAMAHIAALSKRYPFDHQCLISARQRIGLDDLLKLLRSQLPVQDHLYDDTTSRLSSDQAWVAELIREKLLLFTHQEIPYQSRCTLEHWEDEERLLRIEATIWVSRAQHKGIVIGHQGSTLKRMGQAVRLQLESTWQRKVFLKLWVKVDASGS